MDFITVANDFVTFYYQTFDTNREQLQGLYRDSSMLTFEGAQCQGAAAIVEKLKGLPFQKVEHQKATVDAQPANAAGNILVMVTGALKVDEQPQPMTFSQSFQLVSENGTFYIFNDIFRLTYPV